MRGIGRRLDARCADTNQMPHEALRASALYSMAEVMFSFPGHAARALSLNHSMT